MLLQPWTTTAGWLPLSDSFRTLSPLNTSGAMYAGVPTVVLGVESVTLDLE